MHAHGSPFNRDTLDDFDSWFGPLMQDYCDASYTPTKGWSSIFIEAQTGAWSLWGTGGMRHYSDPIGTSTDVSLYYTMSVTRSDAYNLAMPTASNGSVTFTSTRVSDWYIVPTASDSSSPRVGISISGGKEAPSTTSSADSGAATGRPAGLLAIAALAAINL